VKYLFDAGKFVLLDLASSLVFVAAYALTGNVYPAIAVSVGAGLGLMAWNRVRGRPIDAMQWLSLVLVLAMGGATLFTHDQRFVMLKPTVIYLAVAAVMLRPGWMNRYLPPIVVETAPELGRAFGYVWAAAMAALALVNLALAATGDLKAWSWFVSVGPVSLKAGLSLLQFAVIRITVRRRLRRAKRPQPCPSEILDPWSPASLAIAGAD